MASFLLLCLGSLIAFAACALLALSQRKHVVTVFGRNGQPPLGRATRPVGWTLLVAALGPCLLGELRGFAVLFWLFAILCAAQAVALLIAFKPSWLKVVSRSKVKPGS